MKKYKLSLIRLGGNLIQEKNQKQKAHVTIPLKEGKISAQITFNVRTST